MKIGALSDLYMNQILRGRNRHMTQSRLVRVER
jgi:hypothetical protein